MVLGYAFFAAQDAAVKWLLADHSLFQILLIRSIVIVVPASLIGRGRLVVTLLASRRKASLLLRAALNFLAWLLYYAAAKWLGLAELTTLYFVAPVMVVALSALLLGERVNAGRWVAVLLGLAGVVIAAKPGGSVPLGPALMTLAGAACWAFSTVLIRSINQSETTGSQVLVGNLLFLLVTGLAVGVTGWTWPGPLDFGLMVGVGVAGGVGQVLFYEGFRYAPASLIAPVEYTGFVWAFLLSYLIWAEIPTIQVWVGALMIAGSGSALVWSERRRLRSAVPDGRSA